MNIRYPKRAPGSLLEMQIKVAYYIEKYPELRGFLESKSKRLTSKMFIDERFTIINYSKLHFGYKDLQTTLKRILLFGNANVKFKHFKNDYIIFEYRRNGKISSFIGMFIRRIMKLDETEYFRDDVKALLISMNSMFEQHEEKYIQMILTSLKQLQR